MANNMYNADDRVYDMVRELIANHHPDLALIVDEIAVVFKDKASNSGGRLVLGKVRKAPPLLGVLGDVEYKFILELGADAWVDLTSRQQQAFLDHLLLHCVAEEEDGGYKYFLRAPDVSFFYEELDRWGDWRPRPADDDVPSIEDVFKRNSANEAASDDDDLDDLLS